MVRTNDSHTKRQSVRTVLRAREKKDGNSFNTMGFSESVLTVLRSRSGELLFQEPNPTIHITGKKLKKISTVQIINHIKQNME
jgi:hypothetical protein